MANPMQLMTAMTTTAWRMRRTMKANIAAVGGRAGASPPGLDHDEVT